MIRVGAVTRDHVGHRTAALAELCAVGVGQDLHLGDRFQVLRLESLPADRKVVVALTVDQKVIPAWPGAVDRKAYSVGEVVAGGRLNHARQRERKRNGVQAVDRNLCNLVASDVPAQTAGLHLEFLGGAR